ncbi:hypothetical protein MNBD_GAMMA04-2126 [hydrothermal vent metagenome]|uniref:Lipoprotein n=1 Tax=hydrothermal vent metagenome TaxID=652676 RepID=A0A3B0W2C3_9ZZZZ
MSLKVFLIIGGLMALQGCSEFVFLKEEKTKKAAVAYQAPSLLQFELLSNQGEYASLLSSTSEEQTVLYLLKQGGYYANLKEPYRLKACKELATVYKKESTWQAGWLLAYSFSDRGSCITHKERLRILNELDSLIGLYPEIKWLNSANIQTLEHINYLKSRNALLKEKELLLENELQQSQAKNIELQMLLKKLKAIEDIMNERLSDDGS